MATLVLTGFPRVSFQAATRDLSAFFGSFGVSRIEWLNGVSLNVHFEDVFSAERALHSLTLEIPVVEGGVARPCSTHTHTHTHPAFPILPLSPVPRGAVISPSCCFCACVVFRQVSSP